jgi:hypothetical protein
MPFVPPAAAKNVRRALARRVLRRPPPQLQGGLQVVNQIPPEDRRAEVISSYMLMGFLGNALPVIGVGVLSKLASPRAANLGFAAAIGAVSLAALMTGIKLVPRSEPRPA